MSSPKTGLSDVTPTDADMATQARPGHGIPSQDPDPAAQVRLTPGQARHEADSALAGGALVAGIATGAAVGVAVGGPVGVVIGASLGGLAGAWGGAAASAAAIPSEPPPAARVRLQIDDSGGAGRPVVLIHGWPLSTLSWAPQQQALQDAGYRVVAYDRRGFGRSEQPAAGYDYDTLADDLLQVLDDLALQDVTLVGFSMGGGEVARFVGRHGQTRLRSVVFAAAVTPCLMRSATNPDGPLTPAAALEKRQAYEQDREAYYDGFATKFYSSQGSLLVSPAQRAEALVMCRQAAPHAALACMDAFASTDFRDDLAAVRVPALVIHGDADAIVPFEGSGLRTHRSVQHSQLARVAGAPHGLNLTHVSAFNEALLGFLKD